MTLPKELAWACNNDTTVYKMATSNADVYTIIEQLVYDKKDLVKRLIELETFRPRKIKLPDGTVVVWHCPDNLIPEL